MQNSYNALAKYYEKVTNKDYLRLYDPFLKSLKNKKVLDLGCGTGFVLRGLAKNNVTVGVDSSPGMLENAKQKDRKTNYILGDIRNFRSKDRFDIVLCMFDTINHLLSFRDWEKVFQTASFNLRRDGIFLLDFNTPTSFNKKVGFEKLIKGKKVIFKTEVKNNDCTWIIKIGNKKINIKEITFPEEKVIKTIKKYFSIIKKISRNRTPRCFIQARK